MTSARRNEDPPVQCTHYFHNFHAGALVGVAISSFTSVSISEPVVESMLTFCVAGYYPERLGGRGQDR
jgi:hypothetical protein